LQHTTDRFRTRYIAYTHSEPHSERRTGIYVKLFYRILSPTAPSSQL